jgi:hypothetical protein
LDRQPIWLITSTGAIIAGAILGIMQAEAMVFTSPAAMEGATTSGMKGYLPNVVAFNGSTIGSLSFSMTIFAAGYAFYHRALPYCLLSTSELPFWLLPLLVLEFLLAWVNLMWRLMPYPGRVCMTGFGSGFFFIINDCYRVIIRGVRLWGIPTKEGAGDLEVQSTGQLLKLATFPYLYYVFFHSLPPIALKAAAGSYEFPNGDLHNFVPNPGMATLRMMVADPFPNATRAELTGIGLFDVLDFPIAPTLLLWAAWLFMPIPMAFFAVRGVSLKTAWPSQRRAWPVQTIVTCLSCWTAPCVLVFDQLLRGALTSAGIPGVVLTWIVFVVVTEANGLMAGMVSALTEIGTDPSTFEPELPQVAVMGAAIILNYISLLPYTIDTPEFWLTLALVKLLPIAMDTVPWRDVRKVQRQPEMYPRRSSSATSRGRGRASASWSCRSARSCSRHSLWPPSSPFGSTRASAS